MKTDINTLITDHIDTWTSAVKKKSATGRGSSKKIELYGIKKLRELILELAVRGKLVPQDPNDESASTLLERIAEEKAQLVKDKKIKKPKKCTEITEDDKLFQLPIGWEWSRLGTIGNIFNGNSVNAKLKAEKYTDIGGLPFIATKDVQYGFEELDYHNGINIPIGELKFKVAHESAVLICSEGGSAGKKCGLTNQDICFGNKLYANELYGNINPRYILSAYLTPTFYRSFSKSMTGIIGGISTAKFVELLVPVPPLDEQHRIVAKVDELMLLCYQLEQQTQSSIDAHKTLVEVLLNTLTDSKDAIELQNNWARVSEFFDTLFTTEHSIEQLKQTILQLAVMGKLVPQASFDERKSPNYEPASKLLERIAAEKAKLIADKKIKKHPSVEPVGEYVKLPKSWLSIVVQDFADIRLGSTPSRADSLFWNGNIPWVSSGEVAGKIITDTTEKITELGFFNSSTSMIPKRSLLMAIIGQGKTRGQTTLLGIDACTNQNVAAFVFNEALVVPEFVWIWAKSKYEAHRGGGRGGAQPALNGKIVRSFKFPLPPFEEQLRIVTTVEELMLMCDQLKLRLNDAQQTQLNLTDALVKNAVI